MSGEDSEFKKSKEKAIVKVTRMLNRKKKKMLEGGLVGAREKVVTSVGGKDFTLSEILKEIEDETEYGKQLTQIFSKKLKEGE